MLRSDTPSSAVEKVAIRLPQDLVGVPNSRCIISSHRGECNTLNFGSCINSSACLLSVLDICVRMQLSDLSATSYSTVTSPF